MGDRDEHYRRDRGNRGITPRELGRILRQQEHRQERSQTKACEEVAGLAEDQAYQETGSNDAAIATRDQVMAECMAGYSPGIVVPYPVPAGPNGVPPEGRDGNSGLPQKPNPFDNIPTIK